MLTDLDMLKRLEKAFPGVYTEKIAEVERFCHWKERQRKTKKRGKVMRQPEFRSMFAVLKPGTWKITNYDDWDQEMPFGKCPACGSWGREDVPGAECPMAWFRCTDDSCCTRFNPEIPSEITDEKQRAFFYQREWNQGNSMVRYEARLVVENADGWRGIFLELGKVFS